MPRHHRDAQSPLHSIDQDVAALPMILFRGLPTIVSPRAGHRLPIHISNPSTIIRGNAHCSPVPVRPATTSLGIRNLCRRISRRRPPPRYHILSVFFSEISPSMPTDASSTARLNTVDASFKDARPTSSDAVSNRRSAVRVETVFSASPMWW